MHLHVHQNTIISTCSDKYSSYTFNVRAIIISGTLRKQLFFTHGNIQRFERMALYGDSVPMSRNQEQVPLPCWEQGPTHWIAQ